MRVAAAPERGKANAALISFLAAALDVPRSTVTLTAGESARDKVVEIAGISQEDAARRLELAAERSR